VERSVTWQSPLCAVHRKTLGLLVCNTLRERFAGNDGYLKGHNITQKNCHCDQIAAHSEQQAQCKEANERV
jgi:hypothetical protein